MNLITRATKKDWRLLVDMGKVSFLEAHGNSASPEILSTYVDKNYNEEVFKTELATPKNVYRIIYHNQQAAGYSKIIFDAPHANIPVANVTKLERLYLLKEFYGLNLGLELLQYNIDISKKNGQSGIWLFVWKENHRAINFYKKAGFEIIGSHDFKISETHANPNHQMFLAY